MALHLTVKVSLDVDAPEPEVEQRALDAAEAEALQFVARLSDRLEADGHDDLRVRLKP